VTRQIVVTATLLLASAGPVVLAVMVPDMLFVATAAYAVASAALVVYAMRTLQ
jgi:hypothetical protein